MDQVKVAVDVGEHCSNSGGWYMGLLHSVEVIGCHGR